MYKLIGEANINPENACGYDSMAVEIDDSASPMKLVVSFFIRGNYQEKVVINLAAGEYGIETDSDEWQRRSMDLAAQLDAMFPNI